MDSTTDHVQAVCQHCGHSISRVEHQAGPDTWVHRLSGKAHCSWAVAQPAEPPVAAGSERVIHNQSPQVETPYDKVGGGFLGELIARPLREAYLDGYCAGQLDATSDDPHI